MGYAIKTHIPESNEYIQNGSKTAVAVKASTGRPRPNHNGGARRPSLDVAASQNLAKALAAREAPAPSDKFRSVIRSWRASPEWDQLAAQTKKLWRSHLDLIEEKWGDAPTAVWNDPRMKAKVVTWRNTRKETPRAADNGVVVLSALLKWAALNGHGIAINAAAEIPRLYKGGNRQEIVWLSEDINRFVAAAEAIGRPWIADGLRLASLTGLRVADLVTLTFDQIGEAAIQKVALKRSRGKRRRVTIPVTSSLEALVSELRSRHREAGVDTLLVNSYGRPWTSSGLTGSFNRIRDAAGIVHVDEEGVERPKHLHDVRGTFCTFLLVECGLTDEEAADMMGWSRDRVNGIRRVYVDDNARVVALAQRIAAKQKAKQAAQ